MNKYRVFMKRNDLKVADYIGDFKTLHDARMFVQKLEACYKDMTYIICATKTRECLVV